jgi:hypothetical protein
MFTSYLIQNFQHHPSQKILVVMFTSSIIHRKKFLIVFDIRCTTSACALHISNITRIIDSMAIKKKKSYTAAEKD